MDTSLKKINLIEISRLAIYGFFTLYQVFSLSSWGYFLPGFKSPTSLGPLILITFCVILGLEKWNLKRVLVTIAVIAFMIIYIFKYGFFGNEIMFSMLVFLAGINENPQKIILTDFFVRSFSVGIIVIISLVGILPKSGNGVGLTGFFYTQFSYGFLYPNVIAFLIMVIFLEYLICFEISSRNYFFLFMIALGIEYYLKYATGIVGILIGFIFIRIAPKLSVSSIKIINFITVVFSAIAMYMSIAYFSMGSNFWVLMDKLLSYRLQIWQYYITNWPITILGDFSNTNLQMSSLTGHGAIDGGYIYYALKYGYVSILLFYITILMVFHNASNMKVNLNKILAFIVIIVITSFPETSGMLVSFSPLYMLFGSILVSSKDSLTYEKI